MTPTLRLLADKRFSACIRWLEGAGAEGGGGVEATCVVMLSHPDYTGPRPFYAKFYNDKNNRSRGLANEAAAYILANRFGLQQPPKACIARIPLDKLDLNSLPKTHDWLKKTAKVRNGYHAFCTEAINAKTPFHHYGKDAFEAMKDDIVRWPDLAKTMAFDDIIANVDRHLNNLIRIGPSTYAVIDHGRLVAHDGNWTATHLIDTQSYTNRLLDILFDDPSEAANGMIAAAEGAISILTGTEEVRHWVSQITQSDDDGKAFNKFVQARTISAPQRLAQRYALC
jgi:hypothetical protein